MIKISYNGIVSEFSLAIMYNEIILVVVISAILATLEPTAQTVARGSKVITKVCGEGGGMTGQ